MQYSVCWLAQGMRERERGGERGRGEGRGRGRERESERERREKEREILAQNTYIFILTYNINVMHKLLRPYFGRSRWGHPLC